LHREFRRRIGSMWNAWSDGCPEPVHAARVDDVALVGFLQHWEEGARAVIDATPAHVERFFPFVTAAGNHAPAADARVVEEKMDLVGILAFRGFIAKPLHLRVVGYI